MWTMPVEFVYSMLLFLTILVLSRFQARGRLTFLLFALPYCLACGKWAAFEFLGGALLADIHLLKTVHGGKVKVRSNGVRLVSASLRTATLLAAGWIVSWPSDSNLPASYAFLRDHAPKAFRDQGTQEKFWFALAGLSLVWACEHTTVMRKLLESGPAQYAGRISFSRYILQHPLLNLVMYQLHGEPARFSNGQLQGKD
jgi:peptidoglycan/LPS O-acetylase OafA/YrhL